MIGIPAPCLSSGAVLEYLKIVFYKIKRRPGISTQPYILQLRPLVLFGYIFYYRTFVRKNQVLFTISLGVTTMKTAAAYIRVSTDDQLAYSPDSQLKLIREYADTHGMTLPDAFIFREADGVSGRTVKKRPEFQRMIAAARAPENRIEAILVWKFSRFARNQEESVVYKSLLRRERGIPVISVSEPIDPENEFGSLIERIIEWMDSYYSTRLSGEVKRGMAERFSRGEHVSPPPYGYCIENKKLCIHPQQAEVVRIIFQKFAAGAGYQTIARSLNKAGIPTGRGGLWEDRAVEYILRNPVYAGRLRWNPSGRTGRHFDVPEVQIVNGCHPPVISSALWEQAQARAAAAQIFQPRNQPHGKPPRLFSGLLRCGACGRNLSAARAGYQCAGYIHGRCAVSHYIVTQKLDRLVLSAICSCWGEASIIIPHRPEKKERAPEPSPAQLLRRAYEKLARAQEAYLSGTDSLKEYQENKKRITCQIQALEERCSAGSESVREAADPPMDSAARRQARIEFQNRLLHILIDHITVERGKRTIQIYYSG